MRQTQRQTQQQTRRRTRAVRGMTLIEIMVVITILGLLMAAVGVAVIPRLDEARRQRVRMDFKSLRNALTVYYARRGHFPDASTGLRGLVETRTLDALPRDPWDNEYLYQLDKGEPRLTSYGGDGEAGGEGSDADLCSCDPPPRAGNDS